MFSRVNQIHCQIVSIKGTFESLLVIVMKISLLAQSKHIDRLLKSPSHSRSVRRGTCAEAEVMNTSGQNILVPAFTQELFSCSLFSWSILSKILISSHTEVIMCLQKEPRSDQDMEMKQGGNCLSRNVFINSDVRADGG